MEESISRRRRSAHFVPACCGYHAIPSGDPIFHFAVAGGYPRPKSLISRVSSSFDHKLVFWLVGFPLAGWLVRLLVPQGRELAQSLVRRPRHSGQLQFHLAIHLAFSL